MRVHSRSERLIRVLLDPLIFVFGLLATMAILLDAMGANILHLLSIFQVANASLALTEILSAVIPTAIITILTVFAAFVRTLSQIGRAIKNNSIETIRHMKNDSLFFGVFFVIAAILSFTLILQILELKNLFNQVRPVKSNDLILLKMSVLATIILNFFVSVMLSAREVASNDLRESIEGDVHDV